MSSPLCVQWMPHSVLAEPAQRPARGSAAGAAGLRCRARSRSRNSRSRSADGRAGHGPSCRRDVEGGEAGERLHLQAAVGNRQEVERGARRAMVALAAGDGDVEAFERLLPAAASCGCGSTGRRCALCSVPSGSCAARSAVVRRDDAHAREAQPVDQLGAVGQRLPEMLAGIEEDDGRRLVDLAPPCAAARPIPPRRTRRRRRGPRSRAGSAPAIAGPRGRRRFRR